MLDSRINPDGVDSELPPVYPISVSRILNYVDAGSRVLRKTPKAASRPMHLQVEIATACNSKCLFCVCIQNPLNRHLNFESFTKTIDAIDGPALVTLTGRGEPTLNSAWPEMVRYCRSKGLQTAMTTNLLTAEKIPDAFLRSGLEHIRISISGATPSTYQEIRGVDGLGAVIEGIRQINRLKRLSGENRPSLSFEYVILGPTFAEIPSLLDLAAEHDITYIHFRPLQMYGDMWEKRDYLARGLDSPEAKLRLRDFAEYARAKGVRNNLKEVEEIWDGFYGLKEHPALGTEEMFCPFAWLQCFVSLDGEMAPCCTLIDNDDRRFGKLNGEGFEKVWNGEAFQEMRRGFGKGRPPSPACRSCRSQSLRHLVNNTFSFKFI